MKASLHELSKNVSQVGKASWKIILKSWNFSYVDKTPIMFTTCDSETTHKEVETETKTSGMINIIQKFLQILFKISVKNPIKIESELI